MQGADPPEPHGPYWLWTANINGRRYRRPAISTTRSTPDVIGRCALTAASADRSSDSGACRACPEEPHPNDMAAWNAVQLACRMRFVIAVPLPRFPQGPPGSGGERISLVQVKRRRG